MKIFGYDGNLTVSNCIIDFSRKVLACNFNMISFNFKLIARYLFTSFGNDGVIKIFSFYRWISFIIYFVSKC